MFTEYNHTLGTYYTYTNLGSIIVIYPTKTLRIKQQTATTIIGNGKILGKNADVFANARPATPDIQFWAPGNDGHDGSTCWHQLTHLAITHWGLGLVV
jgi:hypothetical protein